RKELIALSQEYFKRESIYLAFSKAALEEEKKPLKESLEKLSKESQNAKKVLEFESDLSAVKKKKEEIARELGKLEGLIGVEERAIESEKRLSASDELKTVRLKEVEALFEEVSLFKAVEDILSKLKDFIHSRKHQTDSRLIEEAEARIREYKKEQEKLEKELKEMGEKESMISEAEKDVFRIMSEENELVSKLSLLKAREERLALEEEEFKRELIEVGHLVGTEIAKYKEFEAGDEKEVAIEER